MTAVELLAEIDRVEHELIDTAERERSPEAEMLVYRFAARMRQAVRGSGVVPRVGAEEEDGA